MKKKKKELTRISNVEKKEEKGGIEDHLTDVERSERLKFEEMQKDDLENLKKYGGIGDGPTRYKLSYKYKKKGKKFTPINKGINLETKRPIDRGDKGEDFKGDTMYTRDELSQFKIINTPYYRFVDYVYDRGYTPDYVPFYEKQKGDPYRFRRGTPEKVVEFGLINLALLITLFTHLHIYQFELFVYSLTTPTHLEREGLAEVRFRNNYGASTKKEMMLNGKDYYSYEKRYGRYVHGHIGNKLIKDRQLVTMLGTPLLFDGQGYFCPAGMNGKRYCMSDLRGQRGFFYFDIYPKKKRLSTFSLVIRDAIRR